MPTVICRHIKINGARCGSPALAGGSLCYHHRKVADHHRSLAAAGDDIPTVIHPIEIQEHMQRNPQVAEYFRPRQGPLLLDLPPLEDRESIQLALSMIVTAMAQDRIETRRASGMIYALQVASANAQSLDTEPLRSHIVRKIVTGDDGQLLAPDEDPEFELARRELMTELEQAEAYEAEAVDG